jgi:hypothetical protein
VDLSLWAVAQLPLKELRDTREVQSLCRILMEINHGRLAKAADVLTHRIREIILAKAAGSSWDKAAVISLLPAGVATNTTMPDNAMAL